MYTYQYTVTEILFQNNTAIQNLNLSNNHFCELGAIDLGEAIGTYNTLMIVVYSGSNHSILADVLNRYI